MANTQKVNQITQGVIWQQLLYFFLPILIGSAFQQLYNTADTIIVGQFVGTSALAAVGATGTLINLLVGFFVGMASGATVIISQFYGAQKHQKVKDAVHTSVALTIVCGVILMVFGIIAAPILLTLISVPEDIIASSTLYIRIYFIGMIPSLFYNVGAGILRAVGDSKRPLYFLIVATLSNIVLDLILVVFLKWGVAGVGIATVLCQFISAVLVLWVLMKAEDSYALQLHKIRLDKEILFSIIRIGLPAGLQSVLYAISNLVIQSSINRLGTDTIAAWSAFGKIDGLFWMMIGAFGVAITTFVGQNFGAGQFQRVKQSVRVCLVMAFASSILLSIVLALASEPIFRLFTTDETVIKIGMEMIQIMTPFYFTFVCVEILSGAIRGVGEALKPMLLTCIGVCGLRIAWIIWIVPLNPSLFNIAICYPITWSATSLLFIIYYLKGNWLKSKMPALNKNEG